MTETDLRLLSRNAVAYETYAKQLFFLGFGLPLWTPEERMEAGDVLLGDVGILQDGSFHRLFNARLPLQHSLNTCYGTPDASLSSYFSLMPQHKYDVDSISPCVIYSQSTQLMAQNTIEESTSKDAIHLICDQPAGALLILKEGATRYRLLGSSDRAIANYMLYHSERWRRFASSALHEEHPGELILIRGCTQSAQWAMAAYSSNRSPTGCSVTARFGGEVPISVTLPGASTMQQQCHSHADPSLQAAYARIPSWSGSQETLAVPKLTSTIFVHYFKLRVRASTRSNNAARKFPRTKMYDPVDPILDYILTHSNARAACAHDGQAHMFCRNGLLPENLGQILKDLSPSIEIDENGIGMLKPDSSAEDAVPIGDKVMLWRWRCTFGLSPMDSMSRYHNARNSLSAWNPDALHELEWLMNHVSTTGSENWSLLADICERASIDEASSKTAVQFLTRIFQNAEPFTQLNAAHLWGTMLQNSRPVFLQQNMSMEFVTVLEKVITSVRTSRMVGHRLLEVLGAASWCSEPDNSIRNLWGRIKPKGAPDIGIPIRTFNSRYGLPSLYPSSPEVLSKIEENRPRASLPLSLLYSHGLTEQGLRQLFNECAVARDNSASLLKAAGLVQKGDEEELQAIQQLYTKCYSSVGYLDQQVRNLKIWAEVYRGTSEPDTLEQQLLETLSSVGNDLDRALVESIRAQKRLGVSWDTAT